MTRRHELTFGEKLREVICATAVAMILVGAIISTVLLLLGYAVRP